MSLAAFGDTSRKARNLETATVDFETHTSKRISMIVLTVPAIATPLDNTINFRTSTLPYLKELKLANPICNDDKIWLSMLIGADNYWDIVQDHTVRGKGPTSVKSKMEYLLSGQARTSFATGKTTSTMLNVLIQHKDRENKLDRFWELEWMVVQSCDEIKNTETKDFYEEYENKSITYNDDEKPYTAKLPWKEESIAHKLRYHKTQNFELSPK